MPKMRKRKGSALLLVVMVFMVISVISTLMLVSLDNTTFQVNSYSVMMQASYLNQEAQEAAVAGLLHTSDEQPSSIIDYLKENISMDGGMSDLGKKYKSQSTIEHVYKDERGVAHYMGVSHLDLSVVQARYNGADEWWAYVKIKTETFDTRNYGEGKKTTGNTNPKTKAEYDKLNKFNYEGSVLVLCQNPVIQVFNMSPEDLKKMEDNQNQNQP